LIAEKPEVTYCIPVLVVGLAGEFNNNTNRMQLLYSSTMPVVEFASVSFLLKDSSELGESIVTASPLSTTPFSSMALQELHEYLLSLQQDTNGNSKEEAPSCAEQLAADDMRRDIPQMYRSELSGIGLYYWMIRDPDFIHQAFSVVMGSKGRYKTDRVAGVVVCVGVSGLFSMQPASPLVRSITTRLQDAVAIMRRMEGDAEERKTCYKALLTTLLLTEDEERRTNGMVESEQVTMELDFDSNEEEQSRSKLLGGIKSKSRFGMGKRGLSADHMNATFESQNSADKARLLEKRSAILSVVEKECRLRKYEAKNKGTEDKKPRRRKNKVDELFRDFDFTTPQQAKSKVAEIAAEAARLRPTPSSKKPALQKPQKDMHTSSRKAPPARVQSSTGILAPPRKNPSSTRRSSFQSTASGKKAQQQRQTAFNAFDVHEETDEKLNGSFTGIEFPGLGDGNNGGKSTARRPGSNFPSDSMSSAVADPSFGSGQPMRASSNTPIFDPFPDPNPSPGAAAGNMRERASSDDDQFFENTVDLPALTEEDGGRKLRGPRSVDGIHRIQVNVALNEDLTCSYKQSKISSCTIEGVVQVQVRSDAPDSAPFFLLMRDPSRHIRMIQENRRYADDMSEHLSEANPDDAGVDYKFTISVPRAENYFPVMRYKCSGELRPVPIRVQTRVRLSQGYCRVALQISSNPANEDDLTDLTIIMGVPLEVRGESLTTSPAGGVWNAAKRSVIWCVAELGDGEKFQLQAQFELNEEKIAAGEKEKPKFPVLVRCQCMYAQLSDVELEVTDIPDVFPAEVAMKLARRFRLSHRERS